LIPLYTSFKKEITGLVVVDTMAIANHPQVQYHLLQEKTTMAQTGAEKAKLSPDIAAGYSNLSIIGYQSPDGVNQKYYSGGDRFNVFSLSVGVPLFNKAAKARIKAGQVNEQVAKLSTAVAAQQLKTQLQQAIEEFKKQQQSLHYYEQTGLQQAALIMHNAKLSFQKGEISYLEWTLLMNNAVGIELNYMDIMRQYNLSLIEIEYLTGK
jgi:heavy metal efflux system protein